MTGPSVHDNTEHPRRTSRREFILLAAASLLAGCSPVRRATATSADKPTSTSVPPATATPSSAATAIPDPTQTLESSPTAMSRAAATSTPTMRATDTVTPVSTHTRALTDTPVLTATAGPTHAPAPTPTVEPTPTPTLSVSRADIRRKYPDGPSAVVRVHHAGVWEGRGLVPQVVRQMLDASITWLTGLTDADQAWAALFDPGERIAIKVNTLDMSTVWTHLPLVMAVTERLREVGVPAEQIVVWDRTTRELEYADYPVNWDGPGVRCYGTDDRYTGGWSLLGDGIHLSDILLGCDALINIPILKVHADGAGMSFALKNHYGTFDRPSDYHHDRMPGGLSELNALPPIADRQRLIIGDALRIVKRGWSEVAQGDSIFMGFDPVALDAIGLQVIRELLVAEGLDPRPSEALAEPWIANSAKLGVGTNDPAHIELREAML